MQKIQQGQKMPRQNLFNIRQVVQPLQIKVISIDKDYIEFYIYLALPD